MKKIIPNLLAFFCVIVGFSQSFNYQAVVRDTNGEPITSQAIGVEIKIRESAADGESVYLETHTVTSNAQGVISLSIGNGNTTGNNVITSVNWSIRNHWLEVSIDITGGTNYMVIGTSKLQSVPYANYAATSGDKSFSTVSNVTSNSIGDIATDDFVFGSSQLANDNTTNDDDRRFFFDKSKGAFRSGTSDDSSWDEENLGIGSAAFGYQNIVTDGFNGFAAGSLLRVRASNGVAFGDQNTVTGNYAFAHGEHLTAETRGQITLGNFNTRNSGSQSNSANLIYPEDRLLVIGNGDISNDNPSDALVMLKSGNTTLNGTLTIDGDNVNGSGDAYTLPAQDGSANQIIETDGNGTLQWVDKPSVANPVFSINSQVISNGSGDFANEDFVIGSSQLDNIPNNFSDNGRLFFDKSNAAFRVGFLDDNAEGGSDAGKEWDDTNIGFASIAMGRGGIAKGTGSISIGGFNTLESTASNSVALGSSNRFNNMSSSYAFGESNIFNAPSNNVFGFAFGASNNLSVGLTFAMGYDLIANRRGQMVLGLFNEATVPNTGGLSATDPYFIIGNGDFSERSNALVMLRNGNTQLNGTLTIDGDNKGVGASYTLPAQDGTANQIMSTDGSGNVSWITAANSGAFSTISNVTSNASGNIATDDFVFGSIRLDDDGVVNSGDEVRMFFDKSKAAFRAGDATASDGVESDWNSGAIGDYSVAMGRGSLVSGIAATAFGSHNNAGGENAFAVGHNNLASRFASIALGSGNSVSGIYAVGLGAGSQATSYGQHTLGLFSEGILGTHNSYVATDALFVIGNGTSDGTRSNALVMRKNGNTTLNGRLTIDADNIAAGRSYTLPAQDGTVNQVMSTDGSGNVSWTNAPSNLPAGGTNGQLLGVSAAGVQWLDADEVIADDSPTNEIELPVGGTDGQILRTNGNGAYAWVNDNVNDADNDPTNEIELPTGGTSGQILISDGAGDSQWTSDVTTNSVTTNALKVTSLPSFSADLTNTLVLSGAGSFLDVPTWTTSNATLTNLHDNGNHFNETTGEFTAPENGLYYFSAQVRFDGINSGFMRLLIGIKGKLSLDNGMHAIAEGDSGTDFHTLNVSGVMKLAKDEVVTCVVYSSADTSWSVQSESGFSGYMITRL